jgi:protein-disulfide isomerase
MDWSDSTPGEPSRRRVLAALAAGAVSLAGCVGGGDDDSESGPADDTGNPTNSTNSGGTGDSTGEESDGGDDTGGGTGDDERAAAVPVRGDPEADVTLEVYEDLGCPHCRNYVQNYYPDLASEYVEGGRIRYEHRDFVVTGEAAAQAASAAREALARHGNDAFWSFTTAIYETQSRITEGPDLFRDLAGDLDMDAEAIATAGANRAHRDVVERDMERGQELGVSGTPAFVVDGEQVDTSGAQSMGDVVEAVSAALDEALGGDPA